MAENSIFSNWDNVVSDGRNDLVFENRHKDYGAFDIRKKYNNYVNRALIISCLSFVLLVSAPKIYSWIVAQAEAEKVVEMDMTQIDLEAPPPIDETEPPPPPPPPPPVMETVKFTPPVVVDEEVIEEAPIITQEVETQISTVTNEGTGTDEIIIPEETGGGAVAENPETPFVSVEEMPGFPGGEEALFKYLGKNINYPAMEKDAGISGTVYVYFVINKEGRVSNAEVKRGVKGGPGLDKEALRVISNMPAWSVGKQNGRPAAVQFTLPVKFVLK
jgi:protein TonB